MPIDTKHFEGAFLLYRKARGGLRTRTGGGRPPKFRHRTLEAAEAEARRLLAMFPESTFVILQEVGRLKHIPETEGAGHD